MESALTSMFGYDRRKSIKADRCAPPPIGCGGIANTFRDELSRKEFAISGLCQKCQDSVFGTDEEPVAEPEPPPERYVAKPDEFVTEGCQMFSGQADAVSHRYHKYLGKSGNTWLVADAPNAAEHVYVTNNPQNTTSRSQGFEGFGGATLQMPLLDGTVFELHGGWHSNSDALFADTGIDVRDKYLTFVVLAKERDFTKDLSMRTILRGIVYKDAAPTLGKYDRYKDLIPLYPEARVYYSQSHGGSSSGYIDR